MVLELHYYISLLNTSLHLSSILILPSTSDYGHLTFSDSSRDPPNDFSIQIYFQNLTRPHFVGLLFNLLQ